MENKQHASVLIIGSGPAGLTASIYTARANLSPILLGGANVGGQLMLTTEVENYPGFSKGILGPDLMFEMIEQAKRFGTDLQYETVKNVDFSTRPLHVYAGEKEFTADSVIIASGASPRWLGLESEQRLIGKGVTSCATCDGAFYKDQDVAVIGGGDSAMEEALFLTHFASKVFLIHRRDEFRASKIMQTRVKDNKKIEAILDSEVVEVLGTEKVEGIKKVNNKTKEITTLDIKGLFIAIGHVPNTDFLKGQIDLLENGYVKTPDEIHTNVEGVFVAGDVQDYVYKQAVTAAGMGCKAALEAEKWLAAQEK